MSDHGLDCDSRPTLLRRIRHSLGHFFGRDHDHAPAPDILDTGAVVIRATKVSLVGLGITALFQALIVVVSWSATLLSDTLHNLTDALTAIPPGIAFAVGRRPATRSRSTRVGSGPRARCRGTVGSEP